MRKLILRRGLLSLLFPAAIFVAIFGGCASSQKHPPPLAECADGDPCGFGGSTSGAGGSTDSGASDGGSAGDATTDATSTDANVPAPDGSVADAGGVG